MANTKSIRNVAIVGSGVIGASWAALYLARGLNVVATDPAPNAEANLRRYIDAAWKDLTALGISPNGSRDHLRFTLDMKEAIAGARFPGRERDEHEVRCHYRALEHVEKLAGEGRAACLAGRVRNSALRRHSRHSSAGFESMTMPLPTPMVPWPPWSDRVRMATLNLDSVCEKKPMAPV